MFSNFSISLFLLLMFFLKTLPNVVEKLFKHTHTQTHTCIVVVQSLSRVRIFATPWTAACQPSLSFTISWSLLKLISIEFIMPSNYLVLHSVQLSLSCVWLFATPWNAAHQAALSITVSPSLFKLMSIELVMPSNHLTLCRPLPLPPSVFTSIRVFFSGSVLPIRWPKYWSFSFTICPSNEYSGLISFRMDWLDLFAVQGNLKSLLQHHSSKPSILRPSALFKIRRLR